MPHLFNFDTNHIIENNIVRLTPLTNEHFQNLLPFSLGEPEIWTYSQVQAIGEEGLNNYLSLATKARAEKKNILLSFLTSALILMQAVPDFTTSN